MKQTSHVKLFQSAVYWEESGLQSYKKSLGPVEWVEDDFASQIPLSFGDSLILLVFGKVFLD